MNNTELLENLYPCLKRNNLPKFIIPAMIVFLILVILIASAFAQHIPQPAYTASYYSKQSTIKEGTWAKYGGRMANGEVFDDTKMVCASWYFPFETKLKITNLANGKAVIVVVKDRGPAKRLARQGRIVDLSKGAFAKIAELKQGIIKIRVDVINEGKS